MSYKLKKRTSLILVAALCAILALGAGLTVAHGIAYAAQGEEVESVSIGHMSDIHYFPIDHCYRDVNNDNYKTSDFYHSMTGDTKLVLESGLLLNYVVNEVIDKAMAHEAPMYVIASGDLCKNGERVALIDVANSLRYMQNEVRKINGYENFQVLATVGNHDLYNTDGALYTQTDGSARPADIISAAQFALIFAGLGFPNANIEASEDQLTLTDYLPEEYWSSEFTDGYQFSTNAENLTFTYYNEHLNSVNSADKSEKLSHYYQIGDELNQLSYTVEIDDSDFGFVILDSTDRELVDDGAPIRVNLAEYEVLSAQGKASQLFLESDGYVSTTPTSTNTAMAALRRGDAVYRRSEYAHITGGRLTEGVLDWVEEHISSVSANALGEMTYSVSFHHNLLPHFEQEDDILKDFTLYNWEYTAKRFLNMGIRYAFTGHQHSSDIVTYTDAEGRTLYDFETGSAVSYESPRRYVTLKRYDCDGKLGEQMTSSLVATSSLKGLKSNHITSSDNLWDSAADNMMLEYKTAYEAYQNDPSAQNKTAMTDKWNAVVSAYPDYLTYIVKYDDLNKYNYNEYISKDIYAILIDRVVDHFLTEDLISGLGKTVADMINNLSDSALTRAIFSLFGGQEGLAGLANYLIDTAVNDLYEDTDSDGVGNYPYTHPNGEKNTYNGLRAYLFAILDDLLIGIEGNTPAEDFMLFGDASIKSTVNPSNAGKMCLKDMASFIMEAHTIGVEISLSDTYEDYDIFPEKAYGEGEEFGYKSPLDKTYRKRMLAAVRDAHNQLISGKFADDLFNALLGPLFTQDDSLLKTLLSYEFDFNDALDKEYIDFAQFESIRTFFEEDISTLLQNVILPLFAGDSGDINIDIQTFDVSHISLGAVINALLPVIKTLAGSMLGFGLIGDDVISVLQNAIDGYITESFKVGLGGIADNIVIAYATDVYPDMANFSDPSEPYVLTPHENYKYGDTTLSYLSTLNVPSTVGAAFNAATQDNGRVPSRLTANFDTENSTTDYTFKFYTAEDVYATFKFAEDADTATWESASTLAENADSSTDYNDSETTKQIGDVTVTMLTQTVPAYVPLIDLGLACLTHGEIVWENADGDEIPFVYGERDNSPKNSVIYYNVTTVYVSGLKAGTKYRYDLEGTYRTSNGSVATFSLAQFAKLGGYDKDHFTFATAKSSDVNEFEFLTIADIQGMIQGMYSDSYKAVNALLKDERTSNFDFVLNAGDMVDNGKNFNQWAMALNTYQPLFANTSQFFAAGNHENGKNAFATYFNYTLPTNEEDGSPLQEDITDGAFYSFDYANSHFTVLNTNDAGQNGLGDEQYNWLKQDLENSNAKWKFVLMHKSVFSGGSHSYDSDVVGMRNQLVPLFAQTGVNMVFAGHDHTYTVTNLVDKDGKVSVVKDIKGNRYTGDGVMYVTLGTLGTKFYEYQNNKDVTSKFDKHDSITHTLDTQTFGLVKVSADSIVFTGYTYDAAADTIKVIGDKIRLVDSPVFDSRIVYGLIGGGAGLVLIAVIVTVVLVAKRNKKKGAPKKPNTAK